MNESNKTKVLNLRAQGKTYREISNMVGLSIGTISWHCSEKSKKTYREARIKKRSALRKEIKKLKSNACCEICGYNRCMDVLQFHHLDPTKKVGNIGQMISTHSKEAVIAEAKKCILLCANCHQEYHSGYIELKKDRA